jgi:hypothetical protein
MQVFQPLGGCAGSSLLSLRQAGEHAAGGGGGDGRLQHLDHAGVLI